MSPHSYFCEVGAMLGWRSSAGVAMLWWMFDESYQHSRETGHATRVTIGGAVASFEDWAALTLKWCDILDRFELPQFHMTDFEANEGIFEGWRETPERRRNLLASLLSIIERYPKHYFGVTREVETHDGNETEAYRTCVDDIVVELARDKSRRLHQKFAIVFARRQGFSTDLLWRAVEREGAEKFGPITNDSPLNLPALQVADIIAYETRCIQRGGRSERYPFRRLRDAARLSGGSFSLSCR